MDKVVATRAAISDVRWEIRAHDFRVIIVKNGATLHYDLMHIEYRAALTWAQEHCEQGDRFYIAIKLPFDDGYELAWILYDPGAPIYPNDPPKFGFSRLTL